MGRTRCYVIVYILFSVFITYTCLEIPERMADPRMERLKKPDDYRLEFTLKSITDEGTVGTANLYVHSDRKPDPVTYSSHKREYDGQEQSGFYTVFYSGHMEDQMYWKVRNTTMGGKDSTGGNFSVKIKLHQNIRSDFIVIMEYHRYLHRWWWEPYYNLLGKKDSVTYKYVMIHYAYFLNRTTHVISLDKPLRPHDIKEAIVVKVNYIKAFDWSSDKINVKVDVQLEWLNDLNYHYPDTFEKITHNSIQLEKRVFNSLIWLDWQELEKVVPTNYKYKNNERTVPNSKVTSVPLDKPAQLRFRVITNNIIGTSTPSSIVTIERPPSPYDLRVVKIDINAKNAKKRDFSLQWLNSPVKSNGGIDAIQIYKNLVEFRIKTKEELWSEWKETNPRQIEVKKEDYFNNLLSVVSTFTDMEAKETQFRIIAFNIFGKSKPSNIVILVRPQPPIKLTCTRITVTKNFPNLRSFELAWLNPLPEVTSNRVIRNWFEYKAYTTKSTWSSVKPPSINVGIEIDVYQYQLARIINVTGLPPEECLFRVKAENYVGFSGFSNIVTIKKPLPAIYLRVLNITLAENNTKKNPAIDIKFQFENPNYDKLNKAYKVKFQYRNALHNYSIDKYDMKYSPWIDTEAIKLDEKDSPVITVTLKEFKTDDKHPAVQFRIKIIGYVSESARGSIVTVVRPLLLTLKLNAIYHREVPDASTPSTRHFEFNITNENQKIKKKLESDNTIPIHLNKVIKIMFDYRISRDINGKEEPWVISEKIELDPKEYGAFNITKYLIITFAKYNYLEVQYRVYGIGYIGTSLPSNIITVKVPSSPREVNCIYYGANVDCNKTCELEIDWRMPESNGTFEILDYIIQYKEKTWRNVLFDGWKNNYSVPENGLRYKRQFITFNYKNEYRIVARSIFGNSLASQILWTKPFASYHLKVDYRKDPQHDDSIIINLEWEKIKDKKIADYIVQSNLFFEHDTRVMGTEKIVNFRVFNVQLSKKIEFFKLFLLDNKTPTMFYLPEFRVITRYVNETLFGPASCTTIFHFSKDEFNKRGASLNGSMP